MSKKLIEQLREAAIYGPCPCPIADVAADRIEELEREIERKMSAAAFVLKECDALQADRDEWKARAEFSYRQRDELNRLCEFNEKTMSALQADNAKLVAALKEIRDDFDCDNDAHRYGATCRCCLAEKTLAATPEQTLAAYRNKVIEECAKRAEAYAYMSQNFNALAEELRAMKEQP